MKKLLMLVMACYGLNARSQVNESKNFLYLFSDSTVYAQKIRLRPDLMGAMTLRVDSRRVPIDQVKFFNNEDGFFANTRKLDLFNRTAFAERIMEGKINLFQQVTYGFSDRELDYDRFRNRRAHVVNTRMLYNKGLFDLRKVNYNNLSEDMADRKESLDLLAGYRKSMRVGTVMYAAAGAAIVASAVTLLSGNGFKQTGTTFGQLPRYEAKNHTGSFLLLGLGAGLGLGGYLMQASGSRNIERAIEVYNK
jgi:hypothetical protein